MKVTDRGRKKNSSKRLRLMLLDSVRHMSKEIENPEIKELTMICASTDFYSSCLFKMVIF